MYLIEKKWASPFLLELEIVLALVGIGIGITEICMRVNILVVVGS